MLLETALLALRKVIEMGNKYYVTKPFLTAGDLEYGSDLRSKISKTN